MLDFAALEAAHQGGAEFAHGNAHEPIAEGLTADFLEFRARMQMEREAVESPEGLRIAETARGRGKRIRQRAGHE